MELQILTIPSFPIFWNSCTVQPHGFFPLLSMSSALEDVPAFSVWGHGPDVVWCLNTTSSLQQQSGPCATHPLQQGIFFSPQKQLTSIHTPSVLSYDSMHYNSLKGCFPLQICTQWLEALWIQFRRGCLLRHTQYNSKLWLVFPLWLHSGLHQVGKFLNQRWSAGFLDIVTHSYMYFTTKFFFFFWFPLTFPFEFPRRRKIVQ